MKITPELAKYIQNTIKVAQLVNIDEIIFEPNMIRGMNEARTAAIIHTDNVPAFPCGALGITRMSVLSSRLNIVSEMDGFTIEAVTKDGANHAFSLTLKAKGTKIDYRCGDPTIIKAKRSINDPLVYRVNVTEDLAELLSKGMSSMGADTVTIICNSEGVSFELVDNNKDVFKHTFAESAEIISEKELGTTPKFAYRYSAKLLLSALKQKPTHFDVGTVGLVKVLVNGISVLFIPTDD